ncbi:MAG: DUF3786 domain-containing protein [Desulfobulbaceae bacterium]|jgi:hypothetical protein|nr:DUF3786 domain-containing protein [Desulfobulbaceae bacterium]
MSLSVVDLYKSVLPRTNCRDCGFPTCLAFAGKVVSEQYPLKNCPHIPADLLANSEAELAAQYAKGLWLRRDMAADALKWARQRAASLDLKDLPARLGGEIVAGANGPELRLPYFTDFLRINGAAIRREDGRELGRYEQVFILNHLAQGGWRGPTGAWKGFIEFPNTVSKAVTMKKSVEEPLAARFAGKTEALRQRAEMIGAVALTIADSQAHVSLLFTPLPRIPLALLFWDGGDDFAAQARLMFDETVTEHLDIESIIFLSERLRQLLCDEAD